MALEYSDELVAQSVKSITQAKTACPTLLGLSSQGDDADAAILDVSKTLGDLELTSEITELTPKDKLVTKKYFNKYVISDEGSIKVRLS